MLINPKNCLFVLISTFEELNNIFACLGLVNISLVDTISLVFSSKSSLETLSFSNNLKPNLVINSLIISVFLVYSIVSLSLCLGILEMSIRYSNFLIIQGESYFSNNSLSILSNPNDDLIKYFLICNLSVSVAVDVFCLSINLLNLSSVISSIVKNFSEDANLLSLISALTFSAFSFGLILLIKSCPLFFNNNSR